MSPHQRYLYETSQRNYDGCVAIYATAYTNDYYHDYNCEDLYMTLSYVRELEELLGLPYEDEEDIGLHYMVWLDNMFYNTFPKEESL